MILERNLIYEGILTFDDIRKLFEEVIMIGSINRSQYHLSAESSEGKTGLSIVHYKGELDTFRTYRSEWIGTEVGWLGPVIEWAKNLEDEESPPGSVLDIDLGHRPFPYHRMKEHIVDSADAFNGHSSLFINFFLFRGFSLYKDEDEPYNISFYSNFGLGNIQMSRRFYNLFQRDI